MYIHILNTHIICIWLTLINTITFHLYMTFTSFFACHIVHTLYYTSCSILNIFIYTYRYAYNKPYNPKNPNQHTQLHINICVTPYTYTCSTCTDTYTYAGVYAYVCVFEIEQNAWTMWQAKNDVKVLYRWKVTHVCTYMFYTFDASTTTSSTKH